MIINKKHKFIFIHIPKCGGLSIKTALDSQTGKPWMRGHSGGVEIRPKEIEKLPSSGKEIFTMNHVKACMVKDVFNLNELNKYWEDYFIFTSYRNPWAMTLSQYSYASKWTNKVGETFRRLGFKGMVKSRNPANCNRLFDYTDSPSYKEKGWVTGEAGEIIVDHIIKLEDFARDWSYVCNKVNIKDDSMPHRNNSKNTKPYWEHYDDETRQIIAKMYKKEIEYFGYKFGE